MQKQKRSHEQFLNIGSANWDYQHEFTQMGKRNSAIKLADQLYLHLNIKHTTTSPAHPQCNAQVKQFNKTVKKYLELYVQPHTLDWEEFIPVLNLSYNTSYHSTIATTPFKLLFGVKPRLPSFPNLDIERVHYGEEIALEQLNILRIN